MLPPLIRHGQTDGELSPPIRQKHQSKNAKVQKPVREYRKGQQAAESGLAFELIKETYTDAIEYRTIPAQIRGLILLFGCLMGISVHRAH